MPPSWRPVPACVPRLCCRRAILRCRNGPTQADRSTLRQRPYAGGTVLLCDNENWNRMRHRSGNDLPQAGHSTCRHDGAAVIPDFRPRIANRCSQKVESGAIRASILDFKPKLANRCSKEAKTGAIPAAIPDFKPRLANRCSQKVKTEVIPLAQGPEHCAAAGECRMGRDFGRRSRPWLREGPAAQRWEGKHRRCAPVRSPCPQAESAAETAPSHAGRAGQGAPSPPRHTKSPDSFLNRDP